MIKAAAEKTSRIRATMTNETNMTAPPLGTGATSMSNLGIILIIENANEHVRIDVTTR